MYANVSVQYSSGFVPKSEVKDIEKQHDMANDSRVTSPFNFLNALMI